MAKKGKSYETKVYPVEANEVSDLLGRVEPILTPDLLKSRYLKMVATDEYTSDELKDRIKLAMNEVEALTGLILTPTEFKERIPYDSSLYKNYIHIKTNHRPIISVQELSVKSSNQETIYVLPLEWIEMGFSKSRGQVNVLPILSVFGSGGNITQAAPNGALIFLQSQMNSRWTPAFWEMKYTAGLCNEEGKLPVVVNQIVGMTAAIDILNDLQTQYIYSSQSLSQDGISQSSGISGGGQPFRAKIEQLMAQRERLMQRIRGIFNSKIFMSNI